MTLNPSGHIVSYIGPALRVTSESLPEHYQNDYIDMVDDILRTAVTDCLG